VLCLLGRKDTLRLRTGLALATIFVTACTPVAASPSAASRHPGGTVCELRQGPAGAGLNGALAASVGVARARLGVTIVARAGTVPHPDPFTGGRCGLVLAAGYGEAPLIFSAAAQQPRQRFLLADDWFSFSSAPDLTRPNVSVAAFEADQGSFLAGYAAAAVSQDHVVGEYGSVNIPTVDLALNGFLAGARAWGEDAGKHVTVLGWDGLQGRFVGNDFDESKAFSITSGLIRDGAHVIFGVAGRANVGAAAAAASHPAVYLVGMYTDGYTDAARYAGRWLTSVVFDMRQPVLAAVEGAESGRFHGGLYVGTLANGGVRLAPFHRLAHLVPAALAAKLGQLRTGLGQGWISTNPAAYVPAEKRIAEEGGS
jgi:basic membrane protein A and related proteins